MSTEAQAARQLVAEFDRCAREKDLDTVLSYYDDGSVIIPPNGPAVVGKEAVSAFYRGLYTTFDIEMTHHVAEVESVFGLVIARGNAAGTARPIAGGRRSCSTSTISSS